MKAMIRTLVATVWLLAAAGCSNPCEEFKEKCAQQEGDAKKKCETQIENQKAAGHADDKDRCKAMLTTLGK